MVKKPKSDASNSTIGERMVPIADIIREAALMMRVKIDDATVSKYAAAMQDGAIFPPIEITDVGGLLVLNSGFHRTAATELNGNTAILALVRPGTMEDATLAAARAGAHEGLARTNKDKRKAAEALLNTEWGSTHSDHMVAEAAGVAQTFVSKLRREMATEHRAQLNGASADQPGTPEFFSAEPPPKREGKDKKHRRSPKKIADDAEASAKARVRVQEAEREQLDAVCGAMGSAPPPEPNAEKPATPRIDPTPAPAKPPPGRPRGGGYDSSKANEQQLLTSLEKVATQLAYVAQNASSAAAASIVTEDARLRSQFSRVPSTWLASFAEALARGMDEATVH